jgi:hypothetical protein
MHTLFLGFFICVLFLPSTTPFLTAPVSTVWNYTRRNLYCLSQTATLYNGTTTYLNSTPFTSADYCLIAISTSLVNNLTQTVTYQNGIFLWNQYRDIAISQCNFSTTMDIGYGHCTPFYYETATSIQLCICSTNDCSATYASCQASVNQALSSPPPLLPVLQPALSNRITCQDYNANYSLTQNIIPPLYAGCTIFTALGEPDYSKCSTYTPNHTVICAVSYNPTQGSYEQMALIEGDYEWWMSQTISIGADISLGIGWYQYQTSTSIATIMPGTYYWALCLCTTDNCNVDFPTCTSGMNIPPNLLANNGSTSSTASATGTSTAATISTVSTTRSTSSASGSSITTVHSLATTSGTSIRHNNVLPIVGSFKIPSTIF